MTTDQLLTLLAEQELLSEELLRAVRNKVADSDPPIPPRTLVKFLGRKGHLPESTVRELLTEMQQAGEFKSQNRDVLDEAAAWAGNVEHGDVAEAASLSDSAKAQPPKAADLEELETPDTEFSSATSQDDLAKAQRRSANKKRRKRRTSRTSKEEWESPLLLWGTGGLILLVLAGFLIHRLFFRETGDMAFAAANEYFETNSWSAAAEKFENYTQEFPEHPKASEGAVKLRLSRIRLLVENSDDYSNVLSRAQEHIEAIDDEDQFALAQDDLADILPKIARGLVGQAEAALNAAEAGDASGEAASPPTEAVSAETTIADLKECLRMLQNNRYVPRRLRPDELIPDLEGELAQLDKRMQRSSRLEETIAAMQQAAGDGELRRAFEVRRELLDEYPQLMRNARLRDTMLKLAEQEQEQIRPSPLSMQAETGSRPSPIRHLTPLSQSLGPNAQPTGNVGYVRSRGELLAVDLGSGELLWQRPLGMVLASRPPLTIDGDAVVIDHWQNDIVRLAAASGEVVWRLPLSPENRAESLLLLDGSAGTQIVVTTGSGKLLLMQSTDGQVTQQVQLPQPVLAPLEYAAEAGLVFAVGQQGSLYALSVDSWQAVNVLFLGHAPGTIREQPRFALGFLFVFESDQLSDGRLRVVSVQPGGQMTEAMRPIRLEGRPSGPPLVSGRRVVTITDRGQMIALDINVSGEGDPLVQVATRSASSGDAMARFAAVLEDRILVAANGLRRLAVLGSSNRFRGESLDEAFADDIFDFPLQVIESAVLHLRRQTGSGAAIVALSQASGKPVWQTGVLMSLAAGHAARGSDMPLRVAAQSGLVFELAPAPDANPPTVRLLDLPSLAGATEVSYGERWMVLQQADGGEELLALPNDGKPSSIPLPAPQCAAATVAGDNLLVPLRMGQVLVLDAASGREQVSAFQPPLDPNATIAYTQVQPVPESPQRFVVADRLGRVFSLQLTDKALRQQSVSEALPTAIIGRLAVRKEECLVCLADGQAALLSLPDMQELAMTEVGEVVWGPFATDRGYLLLNAKRELILLDGEGTIVRNESLPVRRLVGAPLVTDTGWVLAAPSGKLILLPRAIDSPMQQVVVPARLASGVLASGSGLYLLTEGGSVLTLVADPFAE